MADFSSNANKNDRSWMTAVRTFTVESAPESVHAGIPKPMNREQALFLARMLLSEVNEMLRTVTNSEEESLLLLHQAIGTDRPPGYKKPDNETEVLAEQADAAVDIIYYLLNALVKQNIDLSPFFNEVHAANMRKRFPDGQFHRRKDGKVLKPDGWKEPNVLSIAKYLRGEINK